MSECSRTNPSGPDDHEADIGLLADLISYHLRRAQAWVFSDFATTMADDPMTPGKFGVLAIIEANPGLGQSFLARTLGVERSTMVEVIDQLEKQGLVARRRAPRGPPLVCPHTHGFRALPFRRAGADGARP
ncbi:MAG: MarR family transcriptional regulator [Rhodospirillales bacterium]|nr:MarR family transcriptional regulator [Rhodospirillales bacterium]